MANIEDFPIIMALAILWRKDTQTGMTPQQAIVEAKQTPIPPTMVRDFIALEKYFERIASLGDVKSLFDRLESKEIVLTEEEEIVMARACGLD